MTNELCSLTSQIPNLMKNKNSGLNIDCAGMTLFLLGWDTSFSAFRVDYDDIMDGFCRCFDLYDFHDCSHIERLVLKLRQKVKTHSRESKTFTVAAFCPTGCHIVTLQKDEFARSVFYLMEQLCNVNPIDCASR